MKRTITCTVCPKGCTMTADLQEGKIIVRGNACNRGEMHAVCECTHPVRSLTSIVRVGNRTDTMVSVKAAAPVPKEKMREAMALIRHTSVKAPIKIGDVILQDVFGTQIVATKEIL